jgi:hypothetical protein
MSIYGDMGPGTIGECENSSRSPIGPGERQDYLAHGFC